MKTSCSDFDSQSLTRSVSSVHLVHNMKSSFAYLNVSKSSFQISTNPEGQDFDATLVM